jgi:hypothetical protein
MGRLGTPDRLGGIMFISICSLFYNQVFLAMYLYCIALIYFAMFRISIYLRFRKKPVVNRRFQTILPIHIIINLPIHNFDCQTGLGTYAEMVCILTCVVKSSAWSKMSWLQSLPFKTFIFYILMYFMSIKLYEAKNFFYKRTFETVFLDIASFYQGDPIGRKFTQWVSLYFWQFYEKYRSTSFAGTLIAHFGYFFQRFRWWLNFTKKCIWIHFGWHFHKLIWSTGEQQVSKYEPKLSLFWRRMPFDKRKQSCRL